MECEWLILADGAQVVGGKLYVLGGGWETLASAQGFPFSRTLAIAVAFSVPWNETNQRHQIEIEIADEDGGPLAKLEGPLEVGRPPGIPIGRPQRIQLAFDAELKFVKQGTYVITVRVEGQESRRLSFHVTALPAARPS